MLVYQRVSNWVTLEIAQGGRPFQPLECTQHLPHRIVGGLRRVTDAPCRRQWPDFFLKI